MKYVLLLTTLFYLMSCQAPNTHESMHTSRMFTKVGEHIPTVEKKPKKLVIHGDERLDNYYWLNERENPDVIQYLKDENTYIDHVLSHTKDDQEALYEEMVARMKKDDTSVPYKRNGYFYARKFEEENEYPTYLRGKSPAGDDEVLLDQNQLAKPYKFHSLQGMKVSPNNKLLLYGEDTLSRRIYTLRIKNLETGELLPDVIPNTSANAVWANDNKTIFYTVKGEDLRPDKVYRHTLGTDVSEDELIFHEKDGAFYTYVYRSNSEQYIMIGSNSTVSTEIQYIDANRPLEKFNVFQPRERGLEYEIEHVGDKFYILTNFQAQNFQLMETPVGKTSKSNWKSYIAHRPDIFIEDFDAFDNFLVITERHKGIGKIRIKKFNGEDFFIAFPETVYTAYTSDNFEMNADVVRLKYTSMVTPSTTYDYNVNTQELRQLKQDEVLGGFSSENYRTEQVQAKAQDGKAVPISLVYPKNFRQDGSHPLYLVGYGSYGSSYDPTFSSVRLSLLDRGFIVGIAHIRGGQELGRPWYENGKLFNKKNTFTDFIDCAEYLIAEKYADPQRIFAYGGSAGGLLMGAITNMRPDLWAGIVSAVPFVDVVTTMLDESIPLTTGEFDEWGNPKDKAYYDYIKSYSPVDNIEAKAYPPILVTTGLHDSQVQYWEPAKYVAKLRDMKTDKNPLLFHTNLEAGHGGASGRFSRLKEWALHYAFVIDLAGANVGVLDK